jgi:hypothetical protein
MTKREKRLRKGTVATLIHDADKYDGVKVTVIRGVKHFFFTEEYYFIQMCRQMLSRD